MKHLRLSTNLLRKTSSKFFLTEDTVRNSSTYSLPESIAKSNIQTTPMTNLDIGRL